MSKQEILDNHLTIMSFYLEERNKYKTKTISSVDYYVIWITKEKGEIEQCVDYVTFQDFMKELK